MAVYAFFRSEKRTENDLLAAAWSNKKDRRVKVDGKMLLVFPGIIFIQYLTLTSNGTPCWLLFWTFSEKNWCVSDWIKSTVSLFWRVLIFTVYRKSDLLNLSSSMHPTCIVLMGAAISILLFVHAMGNNGSSHLCIEGNNTPICSCITIHSEYREFPTPNFLKSVKLI